jgi:hypothetical protein
MVDNVDGLYLVADSGPVVASNNHIYRNTYQGGDYEVINNTSHNIDLSYNFWWVTDALSIALLIDGGSNFIPFLTSPSDSVPGEPADVTSVTVMAADTYIHPLIGGLSIGDTLYIQLEGDDWNSSFVEPALVVITSQKDPQGIGVSLLETGTATGLYRGIACVAPLSSDVDNRIGANSSDVIVLRAHVDSTKRDTVAICATGMIEEQGGRGNPVPGSFRLSPNYPNPFNGTTEIAYQIPLPVFTRLGIYNISGQLVRVLVEEIQEAGRYVVRWDGRNIGGHRVTSGIYICRLKAGSFVGMNKMILLR